MSRQDHEAEVLSLPVGGLDGLGSFSCNLAGPLGEFTRLFQQSKKLNTPVPPAEWDLRRLESRRISLAALTAFVAVAHRLRIFSEEAPAARVTWNPEVFGFLSDTGVLDILRQGDLIHLSEHDVGGYGHETGKTNPWTRILLFDLTDDLPPRDDEQALVDWKDQTRRELSNRILERTGRLFRPSQKLQFKPEFVKTVVSACAELCLNSNLWGGSPAVLGLQRSTVGVSVAVADCGEGLLKTLSAPTTRRPSVNVQTHASACLAAATYNRNEYGLWRVIDEIVALPNAWVSIWTADAELHLKAPLWLYLRDCKPEDFEHETPIPDLRGRVTSEQRDQGYVRTWSAGVRGVRVAFEVSFRGRAW